MKNKKRYAKVMEMLKATAESPSNAVAALKKRLCSRQTIKRLMILRATKNISQEEMAAKFGRTQGFISKLENDDDNNLRIGELRQYLDALGWDIQLLLYQKDVSSADLVKFHFFQTKDLLEKLMSLSHKDKDIAKGITGLFNDAMLNYVKLMLDKAKDLLTAAQAEIPFIQSVGEDDAAEIAPPQGGF